MAPWRLLLWPCLHRCLCHLKEVMFSFGWCCAPKIGATVSKYAILPDVLQRAVPVKLCKHIIIHYLWLTGLCTLQRNVLPYITMALMLLACLVDRTSITAFPITRRKVSTSVRSLLTSSRNAVQLRMIMPAGWGVWYFLSVTDWTAN